MKKRAIAKIDIRVEYYGRMAEYGTTDIFC
jgi:hypothetical protein